MALFKPAKKRLNQNRALVQRMWRALHSTTVRGLDALPKLEDLSAAKSQLSSDTQSPSAAPGQGDEVSKFSFTPKWKLLKNMETGIHANSKPELI